MRARVPVLLLFLLALASSVLAADTHPFNVNDMWSMKRISDPQVSPDGKWVLFTLRVTDFEANKGRTDLWVIGADGKNMRQLTMDPGSDTNGRWSPDGSI
ncbi:MAG TPA: S9 family peptidase, partial [Candidatus Krumholzibacteria bacterium]